MIAIWAWMSQVKLNLIDTTKTKFIQHYMCKHSHWNGHEGFNINKNVYNFHHVHVLCEKFGWTITNAY